MDDEPLAVFVFEDHGPAEITHLDFPGFVGHFILHSCCCPDQIAIWMDRGIVIDGELRALVTGENAPDSLLVLVPAAVFQWRDIEERVRAGGVELRRVGGIESGPTIPDFLQVGLVGSSTGRATSSSPTSWSGQNRTAPAQKGRALSK